MMSEQGIIGISLLALSALGFAPTADAIPHAPFSEEQRTEIREIVRDYLLEEPEILLEVSQVLQEREMDLRQQHTVEAIERNLDSLFFGAMSPVGGNLDGDITMVEFFDYRCPHCRNMKTVLAELHEKHPNIRMIYKEWPIFGGVSDFAAQAALAANLQGKYEELHEALMSSPQRPDSEEDVLKIARGIEGLDVKQMQKDMSSEAIKEHLEDNHRIAVELGLSGTPAYIMINTPTAKANATMESLNPQYLPGAVPIEYFEVAIDNVEAGRDE